MNYDVPNLDDDEVFAQSDWALNYDVGPDEMPGFDDVYEVDDEAPPEPKVRRKVIAAGRGHMNPDLWVTAAEAQKRWGIPANRVYRWHNRKMIRTRGHRGRAPLYALPELRTLNRLASLDPRSTEQRAA